LPWIVGLQAIVFVYIGLYRGVWRFASVSDLKLIILAVGFSAIVIIAVLLMLNLDIVIPRSVLVLDPILLILLMGGSRFIYRAWKDHQIYGTTLRQGNPVLVLGAGEAAVTLVKELARSSQWQVLGLLDDDVRLTGREVFGVKVRGAIHDLEVISRRYGIQHVIVAMPAVHHLKRRQAIDLANRLGLEVLTVPALDDMISGKVSVSQIRKVDVEDLLGRDPVQLDNSGLTHLIKAGSVVVTGAGGSIGSELCRQIVKFNPHTLLCLDISEYALYQLEQEFSAQQLPVQLVYLTCDVKNKPRLTTLLAQYQPSVVFHAAAYKHVPMMENRNVWEALSNNVMGTYTLAQACKEANVAKFVLISTDKAVNPTNVMGASKRLAEMVCQGLQDELTPDEAGTRFVMVRFGNVLGSSGSVIPKFREQIAQGGPITITHPEITRYFMSIPEAAQLVMQAGLMGQGGEIFVLDMGEPVKIASLAADMIRLSGLQSDEIEIQYIGLRPGEKLYEELLADDEHTIPTPHEKLRIAKARKPVAAWVDKLLQWINQSHSANEALIKTELAVWVEEYNPHLPANLDISTTVAVKPATIH
jgi:FlaA1/EpsC-like NDP-sugar epimerase